MSPDCYSVNMVAKKIRPQVMSSEETSDTVDSMKAKIQVKEDCVVSVPVSLRCCDRDLRRCGAETDDVKNPDG